MNVATFLIIPIGKNSFFLGHMYICSRRVGSQDEPPRKHTTSVFLILQEVDGQGLDWQGSVGIPTVPNIIVEPSLGASIL